MTDMQGTDSFKIPSLTFTTAAVIGTEGSVYTPAEPTAGEIEFNPYKLKRLAKATEEMVEDSRYNVWSMILQPDFEQSFVEGENNYFTTGTGSGQPQGVLYGATTGVTTASPTAIAADELIDLFYSVDYKYREDSTFAWMMNDSTLKVIRKLKDGDGNYLWAAGLGGQPDTILSKRVITNNAFPAIATGQSTILVGAFRYYRIASWPGLQIQRLVEKYADTGHIGFRAYRRIDANIMQAAAFRKLVQA
jgi:HK97 family phage major capsid protein